MEEFNKNNSGRRIAWRMRGQTSENPDWASHWIVGAHRGLGRSWDDPRSGATTSTFAGFTTTESAHR